MTLTRWTTHRPTHLAALACLLLGVACSSAGDTGAAPDASADIGADTTGGDAYEVDTDGFDARPVDDVGDTGAGDGDTNPDAGDTGGPVDDPLACPPLPPSQATTVTVSPGQAAELPQMVRTAAPNTTFLLQDGTYELGDGQTLQFRAEGLTLRSASNDSAGVILDGGYDANTLAYITASDATIAHVTLTRARHHPIHITPPSDATDHVTNPLIYDVRIIDGAQQFVKINANGSRSAWVDDGRVECSYFELTDAGRPHVDRSGTGCYTGGVDAHGARGWVVRNNDFYDIYCAGEGLAEHAVHFWRGSRDTLVENNRIFNCARGVGFGLTRDGQGRTYADDPYPNTDGLVGHIDGLIRNNIIFADHDWYDTGIELAQSPGARVHHNTIYTVAASAAFSSIDYRFANTDAHIHNNLVDRITERNEARATVSHNLEGIGADLFADAAARDFHLVGAAADAIDQGVDVAEAGIDIDGEPRPKGAAPDIGADEY